MLLQLFGGGKKAADGLCHCLHVMIPLILTRNSHWSILHFMRKRPTLFPSPLEDGRRKMAHTVQNASSSLTSLEALRSDLVQSHGSACTKPGLGGCTYAMLMACICSLTPLYLYVHAHRPLPPPS